MAVVLLNDGELAQRLRAQDVAVHVIPEAQHGFFSLLLCIIKLLRTLRPAVVHTHRQKENILGGIAAALRRIPSVRTVHGSPETIARGAARWRNALISGADRWVGTHLQRVIVAVSPDLQKKLRQSFPAGRVWLIPNGVDLGMAAEVNSRGPYSRFRPEGAVHVGLAGRLEAVKRVDLFIAMARQLRTRDSRDWRFHIFGDGALRERLEAQARATGMADVLTFHGHCSNILPLLARLDVLLMTSDHEGLPMVAMEAIAVGTPVVAHAVGGLVPLLDGNVGGVLVAAHSPEGYANAVVELMDSDRLALIDAGRDRLQRHYSAATNAQSVSGLYSSLMEA